MVIKPNLTALWILHKRFMIFLLRNPKA